MADWRIYVDWGNDRHFDSPADDISADVVRAEWRLGMGRAYQSVTDESTCVVVVDNTSGKYSPQNPASPLVGMIAPQRLVKKIGRAHV